MRAKQGGLVLETGRWRKMKEYMNEDLGDKIPGGEYVHDLALATTAKPPHAYTGIAACGRKAISFTSAIPRGILVITSRRTCQSDTEDDAPWRAPRG